MPRFAMARPLSVRTCCSAVDFYREEFLKHQRCLDAQREYYSERAICEVEAVLRRILAELDHLTMRQDAEQIVSGLLRKIDVLTGLSACSDRKQVN
jgi:hypothetical protein